MSHVSEKAWEEFRDGGNFPTLEVFFCVHKSSVIFISAFVYLKVIFCNISSCKSWLFTCLTPIWETRNKNWLYFVLKNILKVKKLTWICAAVSILYAEVKVSSSCWSRSWERTKERTNMVSCAAVSARCRRLQHVYIPCIQSYIYRTHGYISLLDLSTHTDATIRSNKQWLRG